MLHNIQILRAIAASLVVLQHSLLRGTWYGLPADDLSFLKGFGASGVDIFFVISGFIMAFSQANNEKKPVEFLKGRFVRIAPLYWSWMALIVLLILIAPSIFRTLVLDGPHLLFSGLFLSQLALSEPPFIDVGWTLEFEMMFYILFALTLNIKKELYQRLVLFSSLLIVAFALDQTIMLEFMLGVMAFVFMSFVRENTRFAMPLLVIGTTILLCDSILHFEVNRLLKWGIPAFLVVLGLVSLPDRSQKFGTYLGDASYSIYLVQVASIPLFYKIASIFCFQILVVDIEEFKYIGDFLLLGSIVFSIFSGIFLYEILEKPMTGFLRKRIFVAR